MLITNVVAVARHRLIRFVVQSELNVPCSRILGIVDNVQLNHFERTVPSDEHINMIFSVFKQALMF